MMAVAPVNHPRHPTRHPMSTRTRTALSLVLTLTLVLPFAGAT
jgi:hypothetical protein